MSRPRLPRARIDELIDAVGPRIHAGQGFGLGRPAAEMPAARPAATAA